MRGYTKWDDQPGSARAAQESLLRAVAISTTPPCGPTYVVLDVALQEEQLDTPLPLPDVARFRSPPAAAPNPALISDAARLLTTAKSPVILMGRISRGEAAWRFRQKLAEILNARVITDLKVGASFPTNHPLHAACAGVLPSPEGMALLRGADVIYSRLGGPGGTLQSVWKDGAVDAKVIQVSLDQLVHNGWSMDYQGLPPVDTYFLNDPDTVAHALCRHLSVEDGWTSQKPLEESSERKATDVYPPTIDTRFLVRTLYQSVSSGKTCLVRVPLGCTTEDWPFEHPLDYLGYDGGAGLGSGPGMCVGAALALKGTD